MTTNEPSTAVGDPPRSGPVEPRASRPWNDTSWRSCTAPIDSLPDPRYAYLNGGCLHLRSEHSGWFHSPQHNRLLFRGTVAGVSRTVRNCIYCRDLPMTGRRGVRLATAGWPGGSAVVLNLGPLEEASLTE